MAYHIFIDPGHGGIDNGTMYQGRKEKDDNLKLGLAVGQKLIEKGLIVGNTRTTDVFLSPMERANMANSYKPDYFISIHRNLASKPNAESGILTLLYDKMGIKNKMAGYINSNLQQVGFKDLGISVRPGVKVLSHTKMPAIFLEVGFINSELDNQLFDEKFDQIADGIADGIVSAILESQGEKIFAVQIGLFWDYNNAVYALDNALNAGFSARIIPEGEVFAVVVGNFTNLNDAVALEEELKKKGFDTLVIA